MAAHRKSFNYGDGRSSKNCEYTIHHFVSFLDCCKVLLDSDQQGELPLMSELFAFRYPSTANTSYPAGSFASWFVEYHQSFKLETMNPLPMKYKNTRRPRAMQTSRLGEQSSQTWQIRSGSRRQEREQYLGTGTFRMSAKNRMSAKKYALHSNSSLLLPKSDEQDLGAGRASQVDHIEQRRRVSRIGFEDPSVTNFCNNHSLTLDDDEFPLQHWMNSACIRNDRSKGRHWDHKLPTNARRLGAAENHRRSRTTISPSREVFDFTNRVLRKSLLKKKRSKYNKQSCQILFPLIPNSHNNCFNACNHPSGSFPGEGPLCVQQRPTIKGNKAKSHYLHGFCPTQSALSREKFRTSGTVKETRRSQNMPTSLSSSTSQRTQGFLQNAKQSSLHDKLFVSEFSGSRCNNSYQRSISKNQRKTLPDSTRNSFTCGLSEFSSRKCGPSTNVYTIPERDSSECTQKVQNVKEAGAKPSQTKGWTTSKDNKTTFVEACERHANDSTGKSTFPDRSVTEIGSGKIQSKLQEQDELARNPKQGDNIIASVKRTPSLSQKYRPKVLKDLIGQNLVAHALSNAISNGRVAPVYLFQGPSGTGKTSAARIFAAALNCLTSGDKKPCGLCTECTAFMSGMTSGFWELDAASHNGIVYIKELIEGELSSATGPRYKIIILDECHMFSQEAWTTLLELLEKPPGNVVIILITTHPDKLLPTVVSRCQKFHFVRIKHSDIVDRLDAVMKLEKLDAEPGALNLIASKSDGSLRDAEVVLDQLSLLEQRITVDTIHQLVGSVSDDKLLGLLNMALRSDTLSTVQRTRDLIDSGVEPLDLMFQLSTLITNILAGSCIPMNTNQDKGCLSMHALSDLEMERLQTALRILSEAEKQLKATSQYRTTWLTAALLHIGSCSQSKSQTSAPTLIASSARQSILKNRKKRALEVKRSGKKRSVLMGRVSGGGSFSFDAVGTKKSTRLGLESGVQSVDHSWLQRKPTLTAQFPSFNEGVDLHVKSPSNLERLWLNMLKVCTPLSLRQLLQDHGKLLAVSFSAVKVVAHLKIERQDPKLKAGFYNMYIVNSFKKVLGRPVEVEISLPPALCSAESTHAPAASWDECVMQSTSKPCVGYKDVKLQNENAISDVKLIQSQRCESDPTFNSTCFSPAVFVPRVTNVIQPELTSISSSTLLVVKKHLNGTEAVRPEQQRPKCAFTYDAKCPLQTPVDCCLQNFRFSRKLQIEAFKERRRLKKPMAGLHARKCSGDGSFASLKHGNSTQIYSHGKENLVLEPQWNCGGLLCWKSQK